MLSSKYVQVDDTTVEVRDRRRRSYPNGHVWAYRNGEDVFCDFAWKRNSEGPLRLLGHLGIPEHP